MPPFISLTWNQPDVSYSIVSHYISTTHELHFNLKGRAGSSPVRPTIAVITGARGHDVSYSFSCTRGKIDANMFSESFLHELHRNKFVNSMEKWKTNRTWLNSCGNVAYKLLETYRSRQATLGENRQNRRDGASCALCMLYM